MGTTQYLTLFQSGQFHRIRPCMYIVGLICVIPYNIFTVLPTKSDSDVIFCLQLFSKTLTCALLLSLRESRDNLCINPILWIGLIHKWSIDSKVPNNFVNKRHCHSWLAGQYMFFTLSAVFYLYLSMTD